MRIWSFHPKYLDRQGLLAVWRETLLAQKVLRGETVGYRYHPQLIRFRLNPDPLSAIAAYLVAVAIEAENRGYAFNHSKIGPGRLQEKLPVTAGQIRFEWEHFNAKLQGRDPGGYVQTIRVVIPDAHPLFEVIDGDIADWEKAA
jgi:hypothetical protein